MLAAALARADAIVRDPSILGAAPPAAPSRAVAIGDPQATAARFFEVLAAHDLLGADGWLAPHVRLTSMGDHFDIDVADRAIGQGDGVRILAWLAAHAPAQVTLLFGNHDAARVMELAHVSDARFTEAAALGRAIDALPKRDRGPATAEFRARFPELATPGYAARDYNAFTEAQRALVQRLLVRGRFALATTARVRGRQALFTHAGVTRDQLALLDADRAPAA
ncbi:MAG: transcriptional regulator, partial [Deltaproteobacteria bacterium]|nr:transcriptional regulator [Deltaproteobacteria bacterium]